MDKKNVLVTGGAGFIGSHFCEALVSRGYNTTCVDNFSTGSRDNIKHIQGLRIIEGDANKKKTWDALKGESFDAIFHYAACVGVRRTEEYPMKVMADANGLRHVAAFVMNGGAKKLLFSSSSEVYGDPNTVPTTEEEGSVAWSPYTAVKMYGEHLLQSLWEEHNIPTVSLRFFNVYGPRQAGNGYGFVTATFVQQVLRGEAPTIFGDGKQTRDFVYISDNIRAAIAAMESKKANGQVINIGTGRETTILDLAKTVITAAGKQDGVKPIHMPARQAETKRRCAAPEKMRTLLGVQCTTTLDEGIAQIIKEYQTTSEPVKSEPTLQPVV